MRNRLPLILLVILVVVTIGASIWFTNSRSNSGASGVEKYTRLDIEIKDGQLVSPAATYLVQPGTKLEFHIISNTFGKITVPTNPLQTITFTESPLIFKFSAPTQPGSYDLPYKANDTDQVINLGIITVRDK